MYRLKTMRKFISILFVVSAGLALSACDKHKSASTTNDDTLFEMKIGNVPFKAEIALTDEEKMRGLMFRESMPENNGMIFVYNTPIRASFWMKNTLIPLDIGFFDKNGVLTEVRKLYPQNLDSVKSSRSDILYCIEMNAGWFEKNKINSATKLDMEKLNAAISARKTK